MLTILKKKKGYNSFHPIMFPEEKKKEGFAHFSFLNYFPLF